MNETIRKLREQHNYSQTYLASVLKVSRQMYIKYENGEVEPPVKAVKALSRLYSIPYSEIIDNRLASKAPDMAAESEPSYCVHDEEAPFYYPIPVEKGYSLKKKIQRLSNDSLKMVMDFVDFLPQKEAEQSKVLQPKVKTKKAFFDLAGKIDIEADAVMELREISKI